MRLGFKISDSKYLGALVLAILLFAAFSSRILPAAFSQYPFNNDSLTECSIASEILGSGHLDYSSESPWYGTHSVYTPAFNVLIAFVSTVLGVSPFECAQLIAACLAMVTIGGVFLLGRIITGSILGGAAAGFAALTMGTFVFITGSAWKESLGYAFVLLIILSFVWRENMRFRILLLLLLILVPLVHHLVATIVFLFLSYMLVWSWYFAISSNSLKKRHLLDALTIGVPLVWAMLYYALVSLDRLSLISSPEQIAILLGFFALLCIAVIGVLSIKNHSKVTLAPIIGVAIVVIVLLDYYGFLFPYTRSASDYYFLLVIAFGFFLAVAWYGTETILEGSGVFRAVQIGLALPAITIMAFGIVEGLTMSSHQILYRTFDFLDIFIFIGLGAGLFILSKRRRRAYAIVGAAVVVALVVSFPFAYATQDLLGVRHDTQSYEIDALNWVKEHSDSDKVISDERIGYISRAMIAFVKDAGLPVYMVTNLTIAPDWICLSESSWINEGANSYPYGRVVVSQSNYSWILSAANVCYVSGPSDDMITIFTGSPVGDSVVYMKDL